MSDISREVGMIRFVKMTIFLEFNSYFSYVRRRIRLLKYVQFVSSALGEEILNRKHEILNKRKEDLILLIQIPMPKTFRVLSLDIWIRLGRTRPYDAALGLQSGSGEPHLWDLVCQGSTRVPSRD